MTLSRHGLDGSHVRHRSNLWEFEFGKEQDWGKFMLNYMKLCTASGSDYAHKMREILFLCMVRRTWSVPKVSSQLFIIVSHHKPNWFKIVKTIENRENMVLQVVWRTLLFPWFSSCQAQSRHAIGSGVSEAKGGTRSKPNHLHFPASKCWFCLLGLPRECQLLPSGGFCVSQGSWTLDSNSDS